jgi:hypothetical protein
MTSSDRLRHRGSLALWSDWRWRLWVVLLVEEEGDTLQETGMSVIENGRHVILVK